MISLTEARWKGLQLYPCREHRNPENVRRSKERPPGGAEGGASELPARARLPLAGDSARVCGSVCQCVRLVTAHRLPSVRRSMSL
ncbi:hypothetical protein MATL_G00236770 [Megalops atlanticus]|uniref:Uncharacterized protein n=1 Tax=Megalops atlanticus TaxID=7932 RepID=A0A9D3T198_MEGAT|nr:hypothetical protein MATL_G00236770 [Megalops atlanticus]